MTSPLTPDSPPDTASTLCLANLRPHQPGTITGLTTYYGASPAMLQRLAELGFMAGETISVLQRGPGGREPIAVQVGDTVFALRRHEASCIQVQVQA